jgi:hypothetical protein
MSEHEHDECRAYMDHIRLQHRQMQQLIERLRPLVHGAAGCESAFDDAKLLVGDLADHFARHVAEEEGGGCLEEAVCRCPRFATQARDVTEQFPRIQAAINRLAAKFTGCECLGSSSRMVEQELEQLARDLSQLESDERHLLREAFGTDESFSSVRTEGSR